MSVKGHGAKAMTAHSDEKTGVNLCSSPRLPGAFSSWTLPNHQLCPCLSLPPAHSKGRIWTTRRLACPSVQLCGQSSPLHFGQR